GHLGAFLAGWKASFAIHRESFAQKPLPLRRLPWTECAAETRNFVAIEICVVVKDAEKTRKLSADFLENFLIAQGNRSAGAGKCRGRIKCLENRFLGDLSLQFCADALKMSENALDRGGNL